MSEPVVRPLDAADVAGALVDELDNKILSIYGRPYTILAAHDGGSEQKVNLELLSWDPADDGKDSESFHVTVVRRRRTRTSKPAQPKDTPTP